MAEEPRIRLLQVSVVITAEFHNPSILNPDFLVSREIVGADWKIAATLTTPAVSVVRYENGIAWTVDPSRLMVVESAGPAFRDHYLSHAVVGAYLEKLPHVPYRQLGLNLRASRAESDPRRWLVERFGAPWLRKDAQFRGMRPTLALDAGDATCNIAFHEAAADGGPHVGADCNLHHEGPLDADALRTAIARWNERQRFLVSALTRLMESEIP